MTVLIRHLKKNDTGCVSKGALPEILGETEILVPTGDIEALSELIVTVLGDTQDHERVRQFNRVRAKEIFGLDSTVVKYADLYNRVVGLQATGGRPS